MGGASQDAGEVRVSFRSRMVWKEDVDLAQPFLQLRATRSGRREILLFHRLEHM
jgi:hypothetical protein